MVELVFLGYRSFRRSAHAAGIFVNFELYRRKVFHELAEDMREQRRCVLLPSMDARPIAFKPSLLQPAFCERTRANQIASS
jgi:hypothetical protein